MFIRLFVLVLRNKYEQKIRSFAIFVNQASKCKGRQTLFLQADRCLSSLFRFGFNFIGDKIDFCSIKSVGYGRMDGVVKEACNVFIFPRALSSQDNGQSPEFISFYIARYNFYLIKQISIMSEIKHEEISALSIPRKASKKEKVGRWSSAESYLFQSLLQRFGKNWKIIHEHMKNRSLSQIRSHAQKFFDKLGSKKVQEYERRAKLLEALETLQKEKQLREVEPLNKDIEEAALVQDNNKEIKSSELIKQEQESHLTGQQSGVLIKESIIKEQVKDQQRHKQKQEPRFSQQASMTFPFLESPEFIHGGYLIHLIQQFPQQFFQYQGIETLVDNAGFRAYALQRH